MSRRRGRRLPWIPFLIFGFLAGTAIEWWLLRPPGPFVPPLVAGIPAESKFIRPEDGHLIRTWTLPETTENLADKLSRQLKTDDGWQPPLIRKLDPKTIQFARVHSPNGDFQFTRITVTALGNGTSRLEIDEEPKQAHAFR
ncbi:MAG TPA: hypothetical protein VKT78_11425 [Fimbriimonadaceae bacterium]|nr:hypothetical protein [Fimbriimonadaceae bacterium]